MPFVPGKPFSGGKLINSLPAIPALGKRFCLLPSLQSVPPNKPLPLAQASLGPLPMRPPVGSELCVLASHRHRERIPRNLVTVNAERAPRMEFRGDDQDTARFLASEAFCRIMRFIPRREPFDRTDPDCRRLRQALHVLLG